MENERKDRRKPGRKRVDDPAINRYGMKLNSVENIQFLALFSKSGQKRKTDFIKAMVFEKQMKVILVDKSAKDFYMRLTNIYEQYKAVGVNYNQIVKVLKVNFAEKKALAMLYKLEKATIELVGLTKEVLKTAKEYEDKWLQK